MASTLRVVRVETKLYPEYPQPFGPTDTTVRSMYVTDANSNSNEERRISCCWFHAHAPTKEECAAFFVEAGDTISAVLEPDGTYSKFTILLPKSKL
jgi:hypothetical protein